MKDTNKYLYIIFSVLGFIFLRSSWGKITGGSFVDTLAGTLGKFASKNPYPFYKDFLENIAIPNSTIFGTLTMWGEFFAGGAILAASLYLLLKPGKKLMYLLLMAGLLVGAFLNAIFWFASAWTSPSTDGLNLVMFATQVIGLCFIRQLLIGKKRNG